VNEKKEKSDRVLAPERNQLREMLRAQAQALHNETARSGGVVPAERLEALRRLSSLVEIYEAAQPTPPRRRWPLVVAFASTLFIASILLFARRGSTGIELDLQVDQMGFVLPARQLLSEQLDLSALAVSGLSRVQLPRASSSEATTLIAGHDFESGIALAVAAQKQEKGEISLPDLILPAQTRVSLGKTQSPGQYRLALEGSGLDLRADVNGPVRVSPGGGSAHPFSFLSPKPVIFEPQSQQVNLDLTLLALPRKISPIPLTIQDLSLLRIEDRRGPDGLPVRRLSTILSGTIYFEELNGQELKLRPGEAIKFEGSEGQIEMLELRDDHIVLQFHGRVRGLTTGSSGVGRSLMPTWLDWLKARQGLYLLWGTAIYLFGLIAGVLRWFKVPQ
jgi:hypothetical protein